MCTGCDGVRDVDIKDELIDLLTSSMDDCHISGRLTISGICSKCKEDH
jgi:Fe2+ or Zn2+ uptake regulation protein